MRCLFYQPQNARCKSYIIFDIYKMHLLSFKTCCVRNGMCFTIFRFICLLRNFLLFNFWTFAALKMVKILGIDDNSEAFSLLVTFVFGIFLFIGTMALYMKVMGDKHQQEEVRIESLLFFQNFWLIFYFKEPHGSAWQRKNQQSFKGWIIYIMHNFYLY